MIRAFDDGGEGEKFIETVRIMRHYLVIMSAVVVAGYSAFLIYAYAMYQVLIEGNQILALLGLFSLIAFLAFAHSQTKSVIPDQP